MKIIILRSIFFSKRIWLFLCFISFYSSAIFASHIIGGDITVKYLSPNSYEVTVTFFRDCSGGGAQFDSPMYIGIYDKVTHAQQQIITLGSPTITTIPMGDACYAPSLCIEKGIYITTVSIPNNPNGYYLSWLRCCRNNAVANIVNPGDEGSVFYAEIADPAIINSSPVFTAVPQGTQGYMCMNSLNTVDFSATDADGDQLVYSFSSPLSCSPTYCGTSMPAPSTSIANMPGPYGAITWNSGYSTTEPLGDPATTLNSTTGLLSATPPGLGVYVLSVKVEEFRASVKIGEIRRDFQFQVLSCQKLTISAQPTTTVCVGQTASLTASGAPAGWTYSWNPGGQTTTIIAYNPIQNGTATYTCTATNGTICITNTIKLTSTGPTPTVTASGNVCLGENTTLTASGGTTYSWNNGATTSVLTAVPNGTYTVTVGNGSGCTTTASGIIYQAPVLTTSVSVTGPLCSNGTASATESPSGGSSPYTYTWSGTSQTSQTATGFTSGTYSVSVMDNKGCTSSNTFSVSAGPVITLSVTSTPENCLQSNATATVTASGGTPAYSYAWNNGQTTQVLTGLTSGNYSVSVSDQNGCIASATVTVSNSGGIAGTLDSTFNVKCHGGNNGKIFITPSGGNTPYVFTWSNGSTTEDVTGLANGTYSVLITDANNCSFGLSANIGEPTVLTSTLVPTDNICSGASMGSVNLSATGATPPYSYSWSNSATTEDISGLLTGTYSVLITDVNSCTFSFSANISEPTALTSTLVSTGNICAGTGTGSVNLSASGGTPPYSYSWSTSATTEDVFGLTTGIYSVTITDNNACVNTGSISITQPPAIVASVGTMVPAGCNFQNGSIAANVSGGTTPYTYTWMPSGNTTSMATGLGSNTYSFNVTDANGCSAQFSSMLGDSCDYVWPGDANDDGVADNLDILAIGIGHGSTGAVRNNASINWIGQPCSNWTGSLSGNVNYKHVDCDGNGSIGDPDTIAVIQNYGFTHNNKYSAPVTNANTDIYTTIAADTIASGGSLITVQIGLGTASSPATNVYGVAYSISFSDPSLVDMSTISFTGQNSWLGTPGTDLISIGFPNGDAALTRTNQVNASGNGIIQEMKFKTSNSLNGTGNNVPLTISITGATIISSNEAVIPVNPISDSLVVADSALVTSGGVIQTPSQVSIWPNPTEEILTLSGIRPGTEIILLNTFGEVIVNKRALATRERVDLRNQPGGIYVLRLGTAEGYISRKILKY